MSRYRYRITTKHRNTPEGVKVTARAELPCGYQIEETSNLPTQRQSEHHAKHLVQTRVKGHRKWCTGPDSH